MYVLFFLIGKEHETFAARRQINAFISPQVNITRKTYFSSYQNYLFKANNDIFSFANKQKEKRNKKKMKMFTTFAKKKGKKEPRIVYELIFLCFKSSEGPDCSFISLINIFFSYLYHEVLVNSSSSLLPLII